MTFDEIERLVGALPASALKYSPWWGNHQLDGAHVQAMAWLNAGREVETVAGRDVESVSVLLVGGAARSPDYIAPDRAEAGSLSRRAATNDTRAVWDLNLAGGPGRRRSCHVAGFARWRP